MGGGFGDPVELPSRGGHRWVRSGPGLWLPPLFWGLGVVGTYLKGRPVGLGWLRGWAPGFLSPHQEELRAFLSLTFGFPPSWKIEVDERISRLKKKLFEAVGSGNRFCETVEEKRETVEGRQMRGDVGERTDWDWRWGRGRRWRWG